MDPTDTVKPLGDSSQYILPDTPAEIMPQVEEMVNAIKAEVENRGDVQKIFSLSDFEIGCRLGRGKFGKVYLAREKNTKFMVALKTILLSDLREQKMELQLIREVEINIHLHHPNILRMFCTFSDETRYYLVLEYAALGALYKIQQKMPNRRFPDPQSANYLYQVASALDYCHSKNVIHRDIKPENLLLDIMGNVKLADFRWSVHTSRKRNTMCGTEIYFPPEIVRSIPYTKTVDNWCVGVLCFEFLTGNTPFEGSDSSETCNNICSLKIRYPSYMNEGAKGLIKSLLKHHPPARLPLKDVMKHKWIVEQMNKPYVKPS